LELTGQTFGIDAKIIIQITYILILIPNL